MNPELRFFDVRKRFGERVILGGITLHLPAGEIIHLSGRNGAGKSTLLKIIAGLQAPDHAEVSLRGRRGLWKQAARRLRQEVVYLHQRPFMFDATVTDNLSYGLRAAGVARARIRAQVGDALEKVDLLTMAARNARTLSGGEQQRLALARAWVLQPHVLLLDEPTANMDIEFRRQTWSLLQSMRSEEMCLVITSHETHGPALSGCRHLHLDRGQLVDGTAKPETKEELDTDNVIRWPSDTRPRREAWF